MPLFRGSKNATTSQGQIVATTEEIVEFTNRAETAATAANSSELDAESAQQAAETAKAEAEAIVNEFVETVFTTDETVNRDDGGIQVLDLSSNVTVSIDMGEGQSLTLHVKGLDTYTVTWPTSSTFIGGLPSTFNPNLDVFEFWVVENKLYGAWVGGA